MDGHLDAVSVRDNEAAGRYEARVDGQLAVITYRRSGERIAFNHTGVPAALEGRGIASKMARVALEDARAAGLAVIPRCPFIAGYIRRHPEYADLVPPAERARYLDRSGR